MWFVRGATFGDADDLGGAEWWFDACGVHGEQGGFDGFAGEAFASHGVAELEEHLVSRATFDDGVVFEDGVVFFGCACGDVVVQPGRDEGRFVGWRVLYPLVGGAVFVLAGWRDDVGDAGADVDPFVLILADAGSVVSAGVAEDDVPALAGFADGCRVEGVYGVDVGDVDEVVSDCFGVEVDDA